MLDFDQIRLPRECIELRREVREFIAAEVAAGTFDPRTPQSEGNLYNPGFSQRVGAKGWIGMTWPRKYGGGERSSLERFVVTEEMRLANAPVRLHFVADRQSGPVLIQYALLPTWATFKQSIPAICRGTALGSILGILPGGGALLSSFASYVLEKKIAKDPSRFGHGAIEGVAGPESANNAGAQTSFIPMLALGMPSNVIMALMIGALAIHGIVPGPQVMNSRPELYWGLIASMFVGNVMLLIINLPLIGIWVRLLAVPYKYMFPAIVLFCCLGVYSINSSAFEVAQLASFGLLGYVLYRLGFEPAPLLFGFVLGPMMEENLRRALTLSEGDLTTFFTRPISAALMGLCLAVLFLAVLPAFRGNRNRIFVEDK